jgi:hypothetical protein
VAHATRQGASKVIRKINEKGAWIMNLKRLNQNGVTIAVIETTEIIITDSQSALDLMATVGYESECNCIAIPKSCVAEEFFVLSTKIAGEILQKFVNYQCKLAIFGDYSHYTSKSLRDFIYECNKGNHIFFVASEKDAIEKLTGA